MPDQKNKHKAKYFHLISPFIFIFLGIGIWMMSRSFPDLPEGYPGPNLFPGIIAGGLVLTALVTLLSGFRNTEVRFIQPSVSVDGHQPIRLLLGIAVVFAFPLLSPYVGFIPALILTGLTTGLILQLKFWLAFLVSGLTSLCVYILFSNLLGVVL